MVLATSFLDASFAVLLLISAAALGSWIVYLVMLNRRAHAATQQKRDHIEKTCKVCLIVSIVLSILAVILWAVFFLLILGAGVLIQF